MVHFDCLTNFLNPQKDEKIKAPLSGTSYDLTPNLQVVDAGILREDEGSASYSRPRMRHGRLARRLSVSGATALRPFLSGEPSISFFLARYWTRSLSCLKIAKRRKIIGPTNGFSCEV